VAQFEREQVVQVEPGGAVVQPLAIARGSAEPQPPVVTAGEPGDRVFDIGRCWR
jgi:hypothetical protein